MLGNDCKRLAVRGGDAPAINGGYGLDDVIAYERSCDAFRLRDAPNVATPQGHVNGIRERLDSLLASCDAASRRSHDPVDFVHRYAGTPDREIAGLVASSLAFGNAAAARKSIGLVLDRLGPEPAALVCSTDARALRRRLDGFVHRIYRADHLAGLLSRAGGLLRAHGAVGEAFSLHYERTDGSFRESLACLADALRGDADDRSTRHLVSDPRAGSACKRLVLYARWMIRPEDGVDLGLWPIPPSALVIPVDTHVHRISRNLGLTRRRTASGATAEEITDALRQLDAADPVKYDFALCHLGVSRDCPSRPDPDKCARCVLKEVCEVWVRPRAASAQKARELRL